MSRTLDDLLPTPLNAEHLQALQPQHSSGDLLQLLDRWVERGWLRALDRAFVSFLEERAPGSDPLLLLAAALASHQLGHGHVCLDLQQTLAEPDFALSLPPEGDALSGPLLLPSQLLANLDLRTWLQRIGDMFTDGRTWLTLLYFVLMLPLGVIYFTIAVTLLSLSLSLIWAPVAAIFSGDIPGVYINDVNVLPMAASPLVAIAVAAAGALLLVLTMHLARGIGKLHGLIAKNLLVRL